MVSFWGLFKTTRDEALSCCFFAKQLKNKPSFKLFSKGLYFQVNVQVCLTIKKSTVWYLRTKLQLLIKHHTQKYLLHPLWLSMLSQAKEREKKRGDESEGGAINFYNNLCPHTAPNAWCNIPLYKQFKGAVGIS